MSEDGFVRVTSRRGKGKGTALVSSRIYDAEVSTAGLAEGEALPSSPPALLASIADERALLRANAFTTGPFP